MRTRILVDTDVLIWHLRGHEQAALFLDGLPAIELSAVTYIELHGTGTGLPKPAGTDPTEEGSGPPKGAHLALVGGHLEASGGIGGVHAASDGLMLADALIAATAIEQGLSLASGNVKHFGIVQGLELVAFEV